MYKVSMKLIQPKTDSNKRDEFFSLIKTSKTMDDIIAYLLASLKTERIPTDVNKIHSAFFKLKQHFPELFDNLTFSKGDLYPYSKELERILFRFQQSNILGTINPTFEAYIISNKSKEVIQNYYKDKYSDEEKRILLDITEQIEKEGLLSFSS